MAKKNYSDYDVIMTKDLDSLIEQVDEALASGFDLIGGIQVAAFAVTLSNAEMFFVQSVAR